MLKRGSEIHWASTHDLADREKLERNSSFEQDRPPNADLYPRTCADFVVRGYVLRDDQDPASAQIKRTARARENRRPSKKKAEADARYRTRPIRPRPTLR